MPDWEARSKRPVKRRRQMRSLLVKLPAMTWADARAFESEVTMVLLVSGAPLVKVPQKPKMREVVMVWRGNRTGQLRGRVGRPQSTSD